MDSKTEIVAISIRNLLSTAAEAHPELKPLLTSFRNFERKHGISDDGNMIVSVTEFRHMQATIRRQSEEIQALEHRIKTLMD